MLKKRDLKTKVTINIRVEKISSKFCINNKILIYNFYNHFIDWILLVDNYLNSITYKNKKNLYKNR